jgi:hypothetical protein
VTIADRLRQLHDALPPHGSLVLTRDALEELLGAPEPVPTIDAQPDVLTWREKLWTVPAETRIGVPELAEALGRSRDGVYRLTAESAGDRRIPHRRLGGELLFTVGDVRAWLDRNEELVHATPTERRRRMKRA